MENKKNKKSLYISVAVFLLAVSSLKAVASDTPVVADSLVRKTVSAENLAYTVNGKILRSTTKQGFAGVRISVVNTRITTMTNEDGTFSLKIPSQDVTLYIDAPSYHSQYVPVKGRSDIEVQLLGVAGNETSFYDSGSLSPQAQSSVNEFSAGVMSVDEDIASRMNGELRTVAHSGMPASGTAFFVGGLKSLNINAQPLFVVDGVIWQMQEDAAPSIHAGFFNNPLAAIDPNDLESVTVLKDGLALYGSKGANGVVLIQTKRSRNMATEISANISLSYRSPIKSIPMMNAGQYRTYASDILRGAIDNPNLAVERLKFLEDDPTKPYYKANHNDTDWLDLLNEGAFTQNYGLSVRGGDETALYAFSMGYAKAAGNIEETNFDRLNVRFNSDINLTDKFKLALDFGFANTNNKTLNSGIDASTSPFYLSLIKAPVYFPRQYELTGGLSNTLSNVDELGIGNPLALIKYGEGEVKKYRLNINVNPSYQIKDNLKVSALFGYSWDKLHEGSFRPNYGVGETPLYNNTGDIYAYSRNMVKDMMSHQNSISIDMRADWNILKNSVHNVNVFGGYRFFTDSYESDYAEGHNTSSDNVTQLSKTDANLRYSTGLNDNWRSMAWYFNADYAYKNRYLLNVIASTDASSRYGKKADNALKMAGLSWAVYPSVSAGWIASSESFMENVDFINFLKLNAGYGIAGNDNILNYETRSYFSSVHFLDRAMGLVLSNIGNEKLKWEETATARVGLDFSMFNNRWSVSSNFYTSKTKDLLTRKKLNEVAGLKYYWSNDGELKNTGFEVATNVRILNTRDITLDFGATIGHYKNEITSLANGSYITDVYGAQVLTQVGQPAGVFYGYKTKGVFSTQEDAAAAGLAIQSPSGALIPFEAGDMYFDDVDGDHVITDKDKQIIGDPNPDFYGNFNFNLNYKGFTVSALFTYSYGNEAYNALRANLEAGSDIHNQTRSMQNRWVANGQVTDIPRATYGDPMGNSRFSDRWIEDASYLRFKSLSLSYKLPVNLSFLQDVSVWGSVTNLCTFTKYLGNDPEFSYGNSVLYQGVDAGLVPPTRSFNFGVKINL